jgi:hypothetical protein
MNIDITAAPDENVPTFYIKSPRPFPILWKIIKIPIRKGLKIRVIAIV